MRDAVREFRAAAPTTIGRWLLVQPVIFLILLLFESESPAGAAAFCFAMIPLGVPLAGLFWIYPIFGDADPTWPRAAVAAAWLLLTLAPAVMLAVLMWRLASTALGVDS